MKYNPSLVLSAYLALSVLSVQAADIASREETEFEIPKVNVFVPQKVGNQVTVNFDNGEFFANVDGVTHRINRSDVSGLPKNLEEDQLKSFLNNGYLTLKSIGNDYGIEANARGLGGVKLKVPVKVPDITISGGVNIPSPFGPTTIVIGVEVKK